MIELLPDLVLVPREATDAMARAARLRAKLDEDDNVVDWYAVVSDAIAAAQTEGALRIPDAEESSSVVNHWLTTQGGGE